jgi:2-polyprenyl-6-methoxyphenol hydroxylase-like FAD-dependent oxidoreductase
MEPKLEIAIAGCGPGGLSAALLLHRQGHKITLFERFRDPQPIGSGLILQPTGLAVMERLGLAAPAIDCGACIDRLYGRAVPSQRVVLDVRYSALERVQFGVGIHRGALFRMLFNAVTGAQIAVETDRNIVGTDLVSGSRRVLHFANGSQSAPFDLVVDALGTQSCLSGPSPRPLAYGALWTTLNWHSGFDSHALEQRYRRAAKMVGILPIGKVPADKNSKAAFFWSIRADDVETWNRAGLSAWKEEVLGLWPETGPLLDQILDKEQLTFARYCHRTLRKPVEPALVHIGDAWHSTSPQLGQGANMALLDAAALGAGLGAGQGVRQALAIYRDIRRSHVRFYQAMSYIFTPFYQSDSALLPWVRDYLGGPISRLGPMPRWLASLVAGWMVYPLKRTPCE